MYSFEKIIRLEHKRIEPLRFSLSNWATELVGKKYIQKAFQLYL